MISNHSPFRIASVMRVRSKSISAITFPNVAGRRCCLRDVACVKGHDLAMRTDLRLFRTLAGRDDLWTIRCEGVTVGSIATPGNAYPDEVWSWSITVQYPSALINKSGREDTREAAMAAFRRAWDTYRAEIGDEGWSRHVEHMAQVDARAEMWRRQREGNEPGGY